MNRYRVVVLAGYSGKVAVRYFETKPKMLKYVSRVLKNASEVKINDLKDEEMRWGAASMREQEDYSKVDWA